MTINDVMIRDMAEAEAAERAAEQRRIAQGDKLVDWGRWPAERSWWRLSRFWRGVWCRTFRTGTRSSRQARPSGPGERAARQIFFTEDMVAIMTIREIGTECRNWHDLARTTPHPRRRIPRPEEPRAHRAKSPKKTD